MPSGGHAADREIAGGGSAYRDGPRRGTAESCQTRRGTADRDHAEGNAAESKDAACDAAQSDDALCSGTEREEAGGSPAQGEKAFSRVADREDAASGPRRLARGVVGAERDGDEGPVRNAVFGLESDRSSFHGSPILRLKETVTTLGKCLPSSYPSMALAPRRVKSAAAQAGLLARGGCRRSRAFLH